MKIVFQHYPTYNLLKWSVQLLGLLGWLGLSQFAQANTNILTHPTAYEDAEIQAAMVHPIQVNEKAQPIQLMASTTSAQNPEMATSGDILVFISFSLPKNSLRQWLEQAHRFQAKLIVRGLVQDSFMQTQARMTELFEGDNGNIDGVVLEPRLFSDYGITQVPAVVVRNTAITCSPTQSCASVYPFDVVAGDMGLEEALSVIARQTDGAVAEIAKEALARGRNHG